MTNNYTIDIFRQGVKKSWLNLFDEEFKKEYFKILLDIIDKHIKAYPKLQCLPPANLVFNAFTYFDIFETKVILIGMDPYIGISKSNIPQAMGLSFSVPNSVPSPPSLKNIFKELKDDVKTFKMPENGNLTRWAKEEKILLLNSALTVMQKNSGIHLKYWEPFTDAIIKYISDNVDYTVFILLGNDAKKKVDLIDTGKHGVITAGHPSPLNIKGGFLGSKIFSQTNKLLEKHNINPIDWNL